MASSDVVLWNLCGSSKTPHGDVARQGRQRVCICRLLLHDPYEEVQDFWIEQLLRFETSAVLRSWAGSCYLDPYDTSFSPFVHDEWDMIVKEQGRFGREWSGPCGTWRRCLRWWCDSSLGKSASSVGRNIRFKSVHITLCHVPGVVSLDELQ